MFNPSLMTTQLTHSICRFRLHSFNLEFLSQAPQMDSSVQQSESNLQSNLSHEYQQQLRHDIHWSSFDIQIERESYPSSKAAIVGILTPRLVGEQRMNGPAG